jgi:hypothetical protein
MTWEYRVIRFLNAIPGGKILDWLQVHRVYYQGDTISAWEPDPSKPGGETLEELREDLLLFSMAFEKPVLKQEDMPK